MYTIFNSIYIELCFIKYVRHIFLCNFFNLFVIYIHNINFYRYQIKVLSILHLIALKIVCNCILWLSDAMTHISSARVFAV